MEDYDIQQINGQMHINIKNIWQFADMENYEVSKILSRLTLIPNYFDFNLQICIRFINNKLTAQEIFDLFSKVGKILKLRLLMEFSGENRGICYISFFRDWQMEEAICRLVRAYLDLYKAFDKSLLIDSTVTICGENIFKFSRALITECL